MHALWKGSISFGLVNIPVRMYVASKDRELKFVMLHKKDLSEIRYVRICKTDGKEVPWEEIVKGYEVKEGDFVILDDEDFEKANLKKTKTIEIFGFIEEDEIDSVYYVKPYFLEPEKTSEKAYTLLREALVKSKKLALAKYVLKNHEHLAVIKVHDNAIVLNELRFASELITPKDINLPSPSKIAKAELDVAMQLINHLSISFKPKDYKDTYTEEIKEIIKQKAKGRPVHPKTAEPKETKVRDIMSQLKASIEEKKKPQKKPRKAA